MQAIGDTVATMRRGVQAQQAATGRARQWQVLAAGAVALLSAMLAVVLLATALRRIRRSEARLAAAEARQRDLLATLDLGAFMARAMDGTIHHWSLGCERLYGWTAAEALGRCSHDLLRTVFPVPLAEVEDRLRRDGAWAGDLRHRARDGREVIVTARKALRRGTNGEAAEVLEVLADVTAQRRAEAALAASEARLRAVLENLFAFVGILAPDGRLLDTNRAPLEATGVSIAEVRGRPYWEAPWWPAEGGARDRVREACEAAGRGAASRFDTVIRGTGDRTMIIDVQLAPLLDDGVVTHLVASAVDITERRRAEERQALLMREVDHRAKNALAVALSLVRLSPREDAALFASAVEGRIAAMARAHSLLAREKWGGADLRAIAEGEMASQAGRVTLCGPPIRLAAEATQPVAMLLHELGTNATKYGAFSRPAGRVALEWTLDPAALRLTWRESGGPVLAGVPLRSGFGSRLLTQLTERQLGGQIALDWAAQGLQAVLTLPLRHVLTNPAHPEHGHIAPRIGPTGPPHRPSGAARAPRVLVVEDEALLAMELETSLRALGYEVVGPARNLAEALSLAVATEVLDAAVLDVNLGGGDRSFPVVDILTTRGVPYLFATGYDSANSLDGREGAAVAVLCKPYAREALALALDHALGRDGGPEG